MLDAKYYAEQIEKESSNISLYILALKQAVQTETKATIVDICRRITLSADSYDYYFNKIKEDKSKSEDNNGTQQ